MCTFPSAWENARANANVKQFSFLLRFCYQFGLVQLLYLYLMYLKLIKTSDDSTVLVGMLVLQKRGR